MFELRALRPGGRGYGKELPVGRLATMRNVLTSLKSLRRQGQFGAELVADSFLAFDRRTILFGFALHSVRRVFAYNCSAA